jgi:hypothetical protein
VFCVVVLSVISFTPLVIPAGEFRPTLVGIPLTLWAGGLIAFALVFLTWVAGRVYPEADEGGESS